MKKNKIIAICGGSATGKTTLSNMLKQVYSENILVVSQDEYYKAFDTITFEEKKKINYDHPNSFDINLLIRNLIKLKNGENVESPIYSFSSYTRVGTKIDYPKPVIILEGMLVLHYPEIRKIIDKAIYLDSSENTRVHRMIERDISERNRTQEMVINQYNRDIKIMHNKYVETQKQYADVIINSDSDLYEVYNEVDNFIKNMDKKTER